MPGTQLKTRLSVSAILMANEDTPLVETGREARATIDPTQIPENPADGEEMFLALAHDAAVNLWGREMKAMWYPERKPSSSDSGSS